eukprot:scaffold54237_cov34-Tisochrysis_lutea.AAC.2
MSDDGVPMRKLRLHKRPASAAASSSSQQEPGDGPSSSAALSSRVSELIPGIADLSLSSAEQGSGPLDVASAVVQRHQVRCQQALESIPAASTQEGAAQSVPDRDDQLPAHAAPQQQMVLQGPREQPQ